MITVCIAAHNEQGRITAALTSLSKQVRKPDRIIVVDDRSTDDTAHLSLQAGAEVFPTVNNTDRKAGALNQVLDSILPDMDDNDIVVCMDADSQLAPLFLSIAERRIQQHDEGHKPVGAVGAIFTGEPPLNFVQKLQAWEYARYQHDLERRNSRAEVISGTAGAFPVHVLRQVAERGFVYDPNALTEDNELTLAIKHAGYRCVSPAACTVVTELMPTPATLYHQRLRWARGGLANLVDYGWTSITAPYILRQVLQYIGCLFPFLFATVLTLDILDGGLPWSWWWTAASSLVILERAWTVRRFRGGPLWALSVIPEAVYDLFQHVVYIRAAGAELTRAEEHWDKAEADHNSRWRAGVLRETVALAVVAVACAVGAGLWLTGYHWQVIAVLVGAGILHSMLRATNIDPLKWLHGSGEVSKKHVLP